MLYVFLCWWGCPTEWDVQCCRFGVFFAHSVVQHPFTTLLGWHVESVSLPFPPPSLAFYFSLFNLFVSMPLWACILCFAILVKPEKVHLITLGDVLFLAVAFLCLFFCEASCFVFDLFLFFFLTRAFVHSQNNYPFLHFLTGSCHC